MTTRILIAAMGVKVEELKRRKTRGRWQRPFPPGFLLTAIMALSTAYLVRGDRQRSCYLALWGCRSVGQTLLGFTE